MIWSLLFGLLSVIWSAQGTYTYHAGLRCECNRKSRYCVMDAGGLRCLDCQGNTAGRHCERCRDGFFRWGAGLPCRPCGCIPSGSVGSTCDSMGRCNCKEGVTGNRCNRCTSGAPIGPSGCTEAVLRDEPVQQSLSCFCYGHSSSCAVAQGYAVHTINSTFTNGQEGWQVIKAQGVMPSEVQFRWVPKHQDLEVISQNSLPVYLQAPDHYVGNQVLSYGQSLSFSLRLDRGVRHPSTSDVVLEGSGLRVGAALGDLRSIIPSGQKVNYSFRLDERSSSRWRPRLSALQFQTLLQNLTAIKIRATFGENGRGYLDNISLVSARRGDGSPASWVRICHCPPGFEGPFCERCVSGFKRRTPKDGAFSTCEPCDCKAGNCDRETGDCFAADEMPGRQSCSPGYYHDPDQPLTCAKCPCPTGVSCSLAPESMEVRCDLCPPGTSGSRCHVCHDGFYGDPLGEKGPQRPCRPCQCNDPSDSAARCDPYTGGCLKCPNNTRGLRCDFCQDGFYRDRTTSTCEPCECDAIGSLLSQCSDGGQCSCKEGFQGLKCHRTSCPPCFQTVSTQVEGYATKLHELETQFRGMEGGSGSANTAQMEKALRAAEKLVAELQRNADRLKELERSLQQRLSVISVEQLSEDQDIQNLAQTANRLRRQQTRYQTRAADVQTLIDEMKRKLAEAKKKIQLAEFPLGDEAVLGGSLFTLIQRATDLADGHQKKAGTVKQSANDALRDSDKSLALMRTLMNKENGVKEILGHLKTMYDTTSGQVKAMENQAIRLSGEAEGESKMAGDMLKQIRAMDRDFPRPLQVNDLLSRLEVVKDQVGQDITGYEALQKEVGQDQVLLRGLLDQGNAAQQVYDHLLARANAAKTDAQESLEGINSNMKGVEDALASLQGFDERIDGSRALAEAAIKRLPAIQGTIHRAVGNNVQTLALLGDVSGGYNDALGTVSELETVVDSLTGLMGSLPSHGNLLTDANKLKTEMDMAKTQADATQASLTLQIANAGRQQTEAGEATLEALGAHRNAQQTKDAVATTLQKVNNLLNVIGQPGSLDEQHLSELESSLSDTRNHVNQNLKPRLHNMEEMEAAQRNLLVGLNTDIDNILYDITNLEDILRSVPNGCYNSPPLERA